MSEYRWSARRQCTKPFLSNRNGFQLALQDQLELKLTAKTRNKWSIGKKLCVLMSAVLHRILAAINICNNITI